MMKIAPYRIRGTGRGLLFVRLDWSGNVFRSLGKNPADHRDAIVDLSPILLQDFFDESKISLATGSIDTPLFQIVQQAFSKFIYRHYTGGDCSDQIHIAS